MQLTRLSTVMPPWAVRLLKPLAAPVLLPRMRRFFSSFVKDGDLVFDVGAHEGEMAEVFLQLGARVVCIEPNPACVRVLRKRFGGDGRLVIVQKGVGAEEGRMELSICEGSSSLSTFSERWKSGRFKGERWAARVSAEMTTLDRLVREHGRPAFCKIDVEGFEPQVLGGLSSPVGSLSFEFTKEFLDDARACAERLSGIGMGRFDFSPYGESSLSIGRWVGAAELLDRLDGESDSRLWGDIYALSGAPERSASK